jgi:hypothetical protein
MENKRDKKAGEEEERHILERQNLRRILVLSHEILRYKHYNSVYCELGLQEMLKKRWNLR